MNCLFQLELKHWDKNKCVLSCEFSWLRPTPILWYFFSSTVVEYERYTERCYICNAPYAVAVDIVCCSDRGPPINTHTPRRSLSWHRSAAEDSEQGRNIPLFKTTKNILGHHPFNSKTKNNLTQCKSKLIMKKALVGLGLVLPVLGYQLRMYCMFLKPQLYLTCPTLFLGLPLRPPEAPGAAVALRSWHLIPECNRKHRLAHFCSPQAGSAQHTHLQMDNYRNTPT